MARLSQKLPQDHHNHPEDQWREVSKWTEYQTFNMCCSTYQLDDPYNGNPSLWINPYCFCTTLYTSNGFCPSFLKEVKWPFSSCFFPCGKRFTIHSSAVGHWQIYPRKRPGPWKCLLGKGEPSTNHHFLGSTVDFQGCTDFFQQFLDLNFSISHEEWNFSFFHILLNAYMFFHQGIRWFPKWPKMRYTNCCTKISLECCDPFWLDHCVAFSIDIPWKKCFLAELLVFRDMKRRSPNYWWFYITGWWFQIFFNFHPYLGKIPILTNIFQWGWHHQPDNYNLIHLWPIQRHDLVKKRQ